MADSLPAGTTFMRAFAAAWPERQTVQQAVAQLSWRQKTDFPATLPPSDSDMAVQVFKDPYLFDFLGPDAPRREAELEQGLVTHVQKFPLELGQGFAFVCRQVHLEIDEDDFSLDLPFYHLKLCRHVVIEFQARTFQPGDGAQLGMYMARIDGTGQETKDAA